MISKAFVWILPALLLASSITAVAETTKGSLDGTTFTGHIGEKATKNQYKDNLVFKDGTFISTACQEQGYGVVSYTSQTKGKMTLFEATTSNTKGDKMMWKGQIQGNTATAKIDTVKADGTKENWWYKGVAKK